MPRNQTTWEYCQLQVERLQSITATQPPLILEISQILQTSRSKRRHNLDAPFLQLYCSQNSTSSPASFRQLKPARHLLLEHSRGVIRLAGPAHLLDRPRASTANRILPAIGIRKR